MVGPGAEPGLVPRNHCKLPLPGLLLGSCMLSCTVASRVLEIFSPFSFIKLSHHSTFPFIVLCFLPSIFHLSNTFPTFYPRFQTGYIKGLSFFNVEKLFIMWAQTRMEKLKLFSFPSPLQRLFPSTQTFKSVYLFIYLFK